MNERDRFRRRDDEFDDEDFMNGRKSMATEPMSKRPLTSGQFAWAISKKSGSYSVVFGPDPMDATDDELFVIPARRDPTKIEFVDHAINAIQDFILLKPGEYAVVHNPVENPTPEYPNGSYSKARNEVKPLKHGSKQVITEGYFPVWLGQKIEVRQIHTLSSNQFLMAVVESEKIDQKAPYYGLTLQCAKIKKAVIKEKDPTQDEAKNETDVPEPPPKREEPPIEEAPQLKLGQRIIIPGNLTPTYLPPSGIEIVVDEETSSMVRQAVVLGPTEFCVLLDEDGQPQVKKGPGRVFPGPYDTFRSGGSRNRVYDAYHLRSDRGILLRIIVDEISKDELEKQLPAGTILDKNVFCKGDEVFICGSDAYLIPSQSFEVIDPETRNPHIGNDHGSVFVSAIGVDQKSGIYVANVETGNVSLVRGEKKMILDPRKEKHIRRQVPARMWNLIIGKGEPHKRVPTDSMVNSPWALSVIIPNNEAVLVTSKDGRKPEVGPKTILLGYEEWLEVLRLSRGRPKDDRNALETCFLRVSGNRISDQITLETSDFVQIVIDVQYSVEFEGETAEEQIKWFNYQDYVKYFCTNLRSRLRAASRQYILSDLYPIMSEFVRDSILGKKPETGHRSGLLFEENNMRVVEVDVLSTYIPDETISDNFDRTKRKIVISELQKTVDDLDLKEARRKDMISKEKADLSKSEIARQEELEILRIKSEEKGDRARRDNEKARIENQEELQSYQDSISRERREKETTYQAKLEQEKHERTIEFKDKLAAIEQKLIGANAKAIEQQLKAIQPELIKAIEGLGDKQALAALASNLPAASGELGLLLGSGGMAGLVKMLGDSPFANALKTLRLTPSIQEAEEN